MIAHFKKYFMFVCVFDSGHYRFIFIRLLNNYSLKIINVSLILISDLDF